MHYHGHRKRLRERLQNTPEHLADYEILEMLLGYVILRADTKPIAKELLSRFGNLRGVVQARPDEYLDIPGLGKGVSGFFQILREFLSRYAESRLPGKTALCDMESVAAMARERLGALKHEEVWLAFVDKGQRLISWEKSANGHIDAAVLNCRAIVERALHLRAFGIIIVHNHPGGSQHPGENDLETTLRLQQAVHPLSIHILDHIIVTEATCYSILHKKIL